MADRVLITTDDLEHAVRVNAALEQAGFDTAMVSSLDDVRQSVRGREPAAIVLSGGLHESTAQRLLAAAREHAISTLGLVEATDEDPNQIGRELGLTGWLVKPVDPLEVTATVRRLIERRRLQQRTGILGESAAIQEVLVKIEQMAPVTSTVLIEGESGTGKELVARAIHDLSPRGGRGKAFIAVNCAAIPDTLLESELFGHEKGAFTGATDQKKGRFELADGGTILIDGVSELQPSLQGKLLRVVQERSFERLAGTRTISVDVRILASTQADLEALVLAGSFRKDLFYRLNVIRIEIPPLRDRLEDVPVLAQQVLLEIARKAGAPPKRLTKGALDRLIRHAWPGNVRELQNVLESAAILEDGPEIPAEAVRVGDVRPASPVAAAVQKLCSLAQIEEAYIREVLRITGNNRSEAARILGINRKTLLEKRKRYGIP